MADARQRALTLALEREEILVAAEDVLRRYGPGKATVVDVARALGVSHGSVYRHFASKAALRDAVVERWLARGTGELTAIAVADDPAPDRLARWLGELAAGKRAKAAADPELFATYLALADESSGAVHAHVEHLLGELARSSPTGRPRRARGRRSGRDRAGGVRRHGPLPQAVARRGVVGPRNRGGARPRGRARARRPQST